MSYLSSFIEFILKTNRQSIIVLRVFVYYNFFKGLLTLILSANQVVQNPQV